MTHTGTGDQSCFTASSRKQCAKINGKFKKSEKSLTSVKLNSKKIHSHSLILGWSTEIHTRMHTHKHKHKEMHKTHADVSNRHTPPLFITFFSFHFSSLFYIRFVSVLKVSAKMAMFVDHFSILLTLWWLFS